MNKQQQERSLGEVHETVDTTQLPRKGWRRGLAYLGPAYLVSVGYMDPGNWATDLQGGSQFGYQLIWVLLMSNLMALLLQSLSARLGVVRRMDLAQANRATYPPAVNFCLYLLAEIAIAACDLAEVLGMALGIYLLTGLPLIWGVSITVLDTFLILWLQQYGIKKLEAFIIALVALIGVSFLIEIILAKPDASEVIKGFVPTSLNSSALYIAIGIIGATVMPHNLYLHSALVQTRKIGSDSESVKRALRYNFFDSTIALNAAFLVNMAILVLAASVFYSTGNTEVAKIEDAHRLLDNLLGSKLAPILFAVALIAAGQSSTITGTLAGQIVMEGYLNLRINPMLRRLLTRGLAIIPAITVILVYGDKEVDTLLVFSQVVLSLQLGFAIIPLIHFVSDKKTMGEFTISTLTQVAAWLVAGILVTLNVKLVAEQALAVFEKDGEIGLKIIIVIAFLGFFWLFLMMTFYPIWVKRRKIDLSKRADKNVHSEVKVLGNLNTPLPQRIMIALDFSDNEETLIARALSIGQKTADYILIHIVESATSQYSGKESDDLETRKDKERLANYTEQLQNLGYKAHFEVAHGNRIRSIVDLTKTQKADLLVMGGHRHAGVKDFMFGETIEGVRHRVEIPVLIV